MNITLFPNYATNNQNSRFRPQFNGIPNKFSKELNEYITAPIKDKNAESKLITSFKEFLSTFINSENRIGSGQFGIVYKIDDEFVLKAPHNQNSGIDSVELNSNPLMAKLKTYYGDFVAKFGEFKILKNAKTSDNFLEAGVKEGINDSWQKMNYYRDTYLKRFSALPQKAFDEVAADFKVLRKERKSFDTINPNNFLADGDTLKITDDIQSPDDKFFNSLAGMMKVFLTSFDRNTPAEYDVMAIGLRRNIFRKLILAGEKNELYFGSTFPEKNELNEALRLCDIQTPWRDIQADLCNLRRRYPNMDERLEQVNKYIDELENYDYNPYM